MESITFLASSGLSFYSPQGEIRFSDEVLGKTKDFRLLQTSKGQHTIQPGSNPLKNVTTPSGDEYSDVGQITVAFRDILESCIGKWVPLPYSRKTAEGSAPSKSNDWLRLWIGKPKNALDENLYQMVFVADTTVTEHPETQGATDCLGFFADDVGLPFEANLGSTSFFRSSALIQWVQNIFRDTAFDGMENPPRAAVAMAAFRAFVDLMKEQGFLPEVTIKESQGQDIDVHLILDLGNSRACGILAETRAGGKIHLDECKKMEIRNLKRPTEVSTEPFDTSFKFQLPLFSEEDPENPVPHASAGFLWPSVVRLGQEAANMDPSNVGDTGMSSPKRYLWDKDFRPDPWYFNLDSSVSKKVTAPFFKFVDENGGFSPDQSQPPFEPNYPASSMMTFLFMEIMCQVYSQINSPAYRENKGQVLARRVLKTIVLTVPCNMSEPEKDVYRNKIQAAVDLFLHVSKMPKLSKPEIVIDFDEATAVQLTYLFGEVKHMFLGDAQEVISNLGRLRVSALGKSEPVLRIASIDIGGGTSDLMISEYAFCGPDMDGIHQRMLFSEGFSVAGDEIAKRIIEKIILKRIFDFAKQRKPDISWDEYVHFFGPGKGERSQRFLKDKAELCRQVWLPMAHAHLEFAEMESGESSCEKTFDKIFTRKLPGTNVLDFFSKQMKHAFGVDITLPEIPWVFSRRKINGVIENVMKNVIRIFSEVIALYDCDNIILGGKPSSLPKIRELIVQNMPVPPEGIIGLKGYPVGSWYPFLQKGGGIADPKAACVVGAAIWLFAERFKNLDGLTLKTDSALVKNQVSFIGSFNPEAMTINKPLFPSANGNEVHVEVSRKGALIGTRRIDSETCTINPLWEVKINASASDFQEPYTTTLKQDAKCRELIEISRVEDANHKPIDLKFTSCHLKTMVDEQYWLDNGFLEL